MSGLAGSDPWRAEADDAARGRHAHRAARQGEELLSASAALSVRGLCKRFGPRVALSGVDLDLSAGEMLAVVGCNGAGKTTLLSIIAGVESPSEGYVSRSPDEVGWVPQQPALYSTLSVAENLRLFAALQRAADVDGVVAAMLAQTGLGGRANERVGRLSGGNRQRVNVALGLLSDPPVIVLDEPSTALDPPQRERLWDLICEIAANGSAVLFSTHILQEAHRYADRVLVLDEGETLFLGAPAQLLALTGCEEFERAFVALLEQRSAGR